MIEFEKFYFDSICICLIKKATVGMGLSCNVGEHTILIGNEKWMKENEIKGVKKSIRLKLEHLQSQGKTVVFVSIDSKFCGLIAIADTIKSEAKSVIQKLRSMNIKVWMITGDNERTAQAISSLLGIENYYAEVLPVDKASLVTTIKNEGNIVAMVGDGVNDSPALVGIFLCFSM